MNPSVWKGAAEPGGNAEGRDFRQVARDGFAQ